MDVTQRLRIDRPRETAVPAAHLVLPLEASAQDQPNTKGPSSLADFALSPTESREPDTSSLSFVQRQVLLMSCLFCCMLLTGCSAFKPLHGTPVQAIPWDERGISRANMETIDLSRLGQAAPPAHLVDTGDVLAVYVEGFLGKIEEVPPVYMPQNSEIHPSLGYPIPVREDGTISLPQIRPIMVRGMTIAQVEDMVRRTYTTDTGLLQQGSERILVSLQKPRTFKVTVLRQETSNTTVMATGAGGSIQLGQSKKGTGQIVVLPVGENDVLRALTLSGGLPGLDAQNAIYVLRRAQATQRPFVYGSPVSQKSKSKSKSKTPIHLTAGGNAYGGRYGAIPSAIDNGRGSGWGIVHHNRWAKIPSSSKGPHHRRPSIRSRSVREASIIQVLLARTQQCRAIRRRWAMGRC